MFIALFFAERHLRFDWYWKHMINQDKALLPYSSHKLNASVLRSYYKILPKNNIFQHKKLRFDIIIHVVATGD